MKPHDDSPDPIAITPWSLGNDLLKIGNQLSRLEIQARQLAPYIQGDQSSIRTLSAQIRAAAGLAVDTSMAIRLGRIPIVPALVDRPAGSGDRPLIAAIEANRKPLLDGLESTVETAVPPSVTKWPWGERGPVSGEPLPPPEPSAARDRDESDSAMQRAVAGFNALTPEQIRANVDPDGPRNGFVELPEPVEPTKPPRKPPSWTWWVMVVEPGGLKIPLGEMKLETRDPEVACKAAEMAYGGEEYTDASGQVRVVPANRIGVRADFGRGNKAEMMPAKVVLDQRDPPVEPDVVIDRDFERVRSPKPGLGINPGDFIFTSYNSGPFLVKSATRARKWFDLACVRITDPENIDAARKHAADSWINGVRRDGDRYLTGKKNPDNAAIPGQPEVYLIPPDQLAAKFEEIQRWRVGGDPPSKPTDPPEPEVESEPVKPPPMGNTYVFDVMQSEGHWLIGKIGALDRATAVEVAARMWPEHPRFYVEFAVIKNADGSVRGFETSPIPAGASGPTHVIFDAEAEAERAADPPPPDRKIGAIADGGDGLTGHPGRTIALPTDAEDRKARKRESDRKYQAAKKAKLALARAIGNPVESTGPPPVFAGREAAIDRPTEPAKTMGKPDRKWEVYDLSTKPPRMLGTVVGVNSTRAIMAAEEQWPKLPARMIELREKGARSPRSKPADPPPTVECNRCNNQRKGDVHPCPVCRSPEYRIVPAVDPDLAEFRREFDRDGERAAERLERSEPDEQTDEWRELSRGELHLSVESSTVIDIQLRLTTLGAIADWLEFAPPEHAPFIVAKPWREILQEVREALDAAIESHRSKPVEPARSATKRRKREGVAK